MSTRRGFIGGLLSGSALAMGLSMGLLPRWRSRPIESDDGLVVSVSNHHDGPWRMVDGAAKLVGRDGEIAVDVKHHELLGERYIRVSAPAGNAGARRQLITVSLSAR